MRRDRLGGEDMEGLLGGSAAPEDAPPGYGRVAELLQAAKGARREPAEISPDFQIRLSEAVVLATQSGEAGAGRWRRSGRKAGLGVLIAAAATSSLAAADVIPDLPPFGVVTGVSGDGTGNAPAKFPPDRDHAVGDQDPRTVVVTVPGEWLVAPAALAAATGASVQGAPPESVSGAHAPPPPPPPPQATPATPSPHVPPGQARRSPGAAPGQGRPGHPGNGNGNGNNGNGNGNNGNGHSNGSAGPQAPPRASAKESPGQGNAYGRDGQPGPPAGRGPVGRGNNR